MYIKQTLENIKGVIKNGYSRETGSKDEENETKNATQYLLDTTMRKQTTHRKHEVSHK